MSNQITTFAAQLVLGNLAFDIDGTGFVNHLAKLSFFKETVIQVDDSETFDFKAPMWLLKSRIRESIPADALERYPELFELAMSGKSFELKVAITPEAVAKHGRKRWLGKSSVMELSDDQGLKVRIMVDDDAIPAVEKMLKGKREEIKMFFSGMVAGIVEKIDEKAAEEVEAAKAPVITPVNENQQADRAVEVKAEVPTNDASKSEKTEPEVKPHESKSLWERMADVGKLVPTVEAPETKEGPSAK